MPAPLFDPGDHLALRGVLDELWDRSDARMMFPCVAAVIHNDGAVSPRSGSYVCRGGDLWLLHWGSGWVNPTPGWNGWDLFVNTALVDQSYLYFNNLNVHHVTIPAIHRVGRLSAGRQVNVEMRRGVPGIGVFQSDANDRVRCFAIEMP